MNEHLYGKLKQAMVQFGKVDPDSVILAFASGSRLHGARHEGEGDLDVAGAFIGRPHEELRLDSEDPKKGGHASASTSSDKRKNSKDDVDVKAYSLRRWAGLALKGNPAALSFLFVPDEVRDMSVEPKCIWSCPTDEQQCEYPKCLTECPDFVGDNECKRRNREAHSLTAWDLFVLPNKGVFLASKHAKAFLGLGNDQFDRMTEKNWVRTHISPVVPATQGYKSKPAMHMIRGMMEGIELLGTGTVTFPRPEKELLLDIKEGRMSLREILDLYKSLRDKLKEAEKRSPLPPECDREAAGRLVADAMLWHWKLRGWT
jgi:hypothetical protein